jgi:hypothetical protein
VSWWAEEDEVDELETQRVRAARNQSLFREVNAQVERRSGRSGALVPRRFVCECLDVECVETIEIGPDDYKRVRAHPSRFFLVPGHEDTRVERVVETSSGYTVVEKTGIGAEVAGKHYRR